MASNGQLLARDARLTADLPSDGRHDTCFSDGQSRRPRARRACGRTSPIRGETTNREEQSTRPEASTRVAASTIEKWLGDRVSRVVGLPPEKLDPRQSFDELGLDSADAVGLVGDLERWLGVTLDATLLWEFTTIPELARFLAGEVSEAAEASRHEVAVGGSEAIAIIGIGCRFPGADHPEAFWELLRSGRDAIRELPDHRRRLVEFSGSGDAPDGAKTRSWGSYLDRIDEFDCKLFQISPREAARMDPQQRLLLEVTWEAFERAGQAPSAWKGSRTGVFIGSSGSDYARLVGAGAETGDIHDVTGSALSIAANRLSYFFDLRGPSLVVDSACSSSLVALHLACQSLRRGECTTSLAGGVSLLLDRAVTDALSGSGVLASDGRCKTFDAAADGYVRGEGCAVVVLKRLSDALAAADPILASIRGSAVNQDGRSNGLTAPSGLAQQALIEEALRAAGLSPDQLEYVEAHGTGTALGDPIEARALGSVLARGEPRCLVGSVKTNIGHLEAAAGIAGLIKVVLALDHQEIPPHLHFRCPNPHIAVEALPLRIQAEAEPWPRRERARRAGVSSFGFGGTNAHVIVEEAPAVAARTAVGGRPLHILPLSAQGEVPLGELARRFSAYLAEAPEPVGDVCFTASTGRMHGDARLAVVGESSEEIRGRLVDCVSGSKKSDILRGNRKVRSRPKLAFLFTGHGAQESGLGLFGRHKGRDASSMGRRLYETQPTFRGVLEECAEILAPILDRPLLSVLYPVDGAPPAPDEILYTQPAMFALQSALARLWQSWGVEPDAVLGHSLGEYAAACVAGSLSLEEGLRLITERARLTQELCARGRMAAVFAGESRVAPLLERFRGQVALAAVNSPEDCVISGDAESLQRVLGQLAAEGIDAECLDVSHAFHSPLMAPACEALRQRASSIGSSPARIPMVSCHSGEFLPTDRPLPDEHWSRHSLGTVRFTDALRALRDFGCDAFLELGPHPCLLAFGRKCVADDGVLWRASLCRGKDDWRTLLRSLGALYVAGVEIDWPGFERDYPRRRVCLPTYPFQRQRCWRDEPRASEARDHGADGAARARPALGHTRDAPSRVMERQLRVVSEVIETQLALLSERREMRARHSPDDRLQKSRPGAADPPACV